MTLTAIAIAFAAASLVFLAMDAFWLSTMNEPLYRKHLGEVLMNGFRLAPAVFFYVIYVSGIVYFAISPAVERSSVPVAVLNGAVLGLVCYATYDLTNQATLKVWSTIVTLADLAWGVTVTASAAAAGTWAVLRFARV